VPTGEGLLGREDVAPASALAGQAPALQADS
jgi:hypothetical protein